MGVRAGFVCHTLAVGVNPQRAVGGVEVAEGAEVVAGRDAARIRGAEVHVRQRRAQFFQPSIAVAGHARGRGGQHVFKVVLVQQFLAAAVAAGADDRRGRKQGGFGAVRQTSLRADDRTLVIGHKTGDVGVEHHVSVGGEILFQFRVQRHDERTSAALAGVVARHVQRLIHAEVGDAVAEVGAQIVQPVHRFAADFSEFAGNFLVEGARAAQTHKVREAQIGVVLDTGFLLHPRASAQQRAARNVRRAAVGRSLIDNQHVQTQLSRTGSRRQTCHARADDQNVRLLKRHGGFFCFVGVQGVLHRLDDALGGKGRAGNDVHVRRLRFDDRRRNLLNRRIGDARRLGMLQDLHFGDFAAADRHGHLNRAVQTSAGAFIDAVCRLRHSGDAAQHHDQRKKQGKELTHDRNPPFFWWCAHQICLCSLKSVSQYPYEKYNLLNCDCQVIHESFPAIFALFFGTIIPKQSIQQKCRESSICVLSWQNDFIGFTN